MRRILKMLARLYPAGWRARYGAEVEALIEDAEPRVRDSFDVLWGAMKMRVTSRSFVRTVMPCALAGALVGMGISLSRPAIYHSRTLIMVDSDRDVSIDDGLRDLVNGAFSASFLVQVIEKENLYPRERARMAMGDVVNKMRKDIWLRRLQKSDGKSAMGLVVEFYYPDPHVAQRVDAELVSQMVAINLRSRIDAGSEATDHIQSRLGQAQAAASHVPEVWRVEKAANLPQRPDGWGRAEFAVVGMLTGLIGGMMAAAIFGARRGSAFV